jgi:MFS transporter, SP family, sugar:H+ symporter
VRYSTYFFSLIGFKDAFVITVIINACQVAAVVLAFLIIRHIGRRILLIVGAGICAMSMLLFAIIAQAAPGSDAANKCITAFICIYVFSFAATWGSIGPIVTGEVPSNRLRSKTVSCALSTNWFFCLAVITGIPYLINKDYANLGTKVGFIFGPLAVLVFIGAVLLLPETKDRTLEEIDEMFLNVSHFPPI